MIAPPPFNFIESLIERRARASSCFLAAFFGLIRRVAFPFVTLALALPKSDDRDCFACFFGRTILAAALIELVDVHLSEPVRAPFLPSFDFLIRHFGAGPVVNG